MWVDGYGWTSLTIMSRMGHACWMTMNMPPVLASTAEDMTFLIVLHMVCMGELCIMLVCLVWSLSMMYQAEAREHAFGKTSYAESYSQIRTMLLA